MIDDGKKVKLHYTLKVDGQIVESTQDTEPMEFEFGKAQLLPSFSTQIRGLNPGEKKTFALTSEEAYGPRDPKALVLVEKEQLPVEKIEVGMIFTANGEEGNQIRGMVKEIQEDKVLIDFNHPLAGKDLEFEVNIIEVN